MIVPYTSVPMTTPMPSLRVVTPVVGGAAQSLARAYLRFASAYWRGDAAGSSFADHLDVYWRSELPAAPGQTPDAISPHGGGGRGIQWYEVDGEVHGHVPGSLGGYRVPVNAIPRLSHCVPACPGRLEHLAWRGDGQRARESLSGHVPSAPRFRASHSVQWHPLGHGSMNGAMPPQEVGVS
jgi:hypothetical protein